jgi:hypothetical protein
VGHPKLFNEYIFLKRPLPSMLIITLQALTKVKLTGKLAPLVGVKYLRDAEFEKAFSATRDSSDIQSDGQIARGKHFL